MTRTGKIFDSCRGLFLTISIQIAENRMLDRNGREIDYLRISVTDRCNLRCRYCMPDGIKCLPMPEILTYEEICAIAETAAELGIRHIKLTGGEPLVRRGLISLSKAQGSFRHRSSDHDDQRNPSGKRTPRPDRCRAGRRQHQPGHHGP